MWRLLLPMLLLGCAACSDIWTVSRIEAPMQRVPSGQAVFLYGIMGYPTGSSSVWRLDFEKYLPQQHKWDQNCFAHHSWRGSPEQAKGGETRYYAFTAPPGDYAYANVDRGDVTTWSFRTPGGQVTYFGTFDITQLPPPGVPYLVRRVDIEAATAFALSLNLPTPRIAEPVLVPGFPWPGCSEAQSTFG